MNFFAFLLGVLAIAGTSVTASRLLLASFFFLSLCLHPGHPHFPVLHHSARQAVARMEDSFELACAETDGWEWHFDDAFTELHSTVVAMEVEQCLFSETHVNELYCFIRACLVQLPVRQWVGLSAIQDIQVQWGFSRELSRRKSMRRQGKHFKYWEWHVSGEKARLAAPFYDKPLLPRTM